jgi:hypothetical protein
MLDVVDDVPLPAVDGVELEDEELEVEDDWRTRRRRDWFDMNVN